MRWITWSGGSPLRALSLKVVDPPLDPVDELLVAYFDTRETLDDEAQLKTRHGGHNDPEGELRFVEVVVTKRLPEVVLKDRSEPSVDLGQTRPGPELENPLDPSSKATGNTRYVLSEIYETPAGIEDHWSQAQESWGDFGKMVEIIGTCSAQTLHGGSITQSLW